MLSLYRDDTFAPCIVRQNLTAICHQSAGSVVWTEHPTPGGRRGWIGLSINADHAFAAVAEKAQQIRLLTKSRRSCLTSDLTYSTRQTTPANRLAN